MASLERKQSYCDLEVARFEKTLLKGSIATASGCVSITLVDHASLLSFSQSAEESG